MEYPPTRHHNHEPPDNSYFDPTEYYMQSQPPPLRSSQTDGSDEWDSSTAKAARTPDSTPGGSQFVLPQQVPTHAHRPANLWNQVLPDSVPCRLYVLVVIIQTCVDLIIEAVLLIKFHQAASVDKQLQEPSARRLPIYFSIFACAHVFQFLLALDAVWMRNTLQFFFLTAFNGILLIDAIFQIFEFRSVLNSSQTDSQSALFDLPINVITAIIPGVICIAEIAYVVLGWSIWREFGWKVYKLLGADRRIKRLYMQYQILLCTMKFAAFFWIVFAIQLIWLVLQKTNVEYYITVAALPASIIILFAGFAAARYENRPLMFAFMASCMGACGYFIFKLFRVVSQRNTNSSIKPVVKTLVGSAVLSILFLIATFAWSCVVLSNFGSGLKFHMSKSKTKPPITRRRQTQLFDMTAKDLRQLELRSDYNMKRMSLE